MAPSRGGADLNNLACLSKRRVLIEAQNLAAFEVMIRSNSTLHLSGVRTANLFTNASHSFQVEAS